LESFISDVVRYSGWQTDVIFA